MEAMKGNEGDQSSLSMLTIRDLALPWKREQGWCVCACVSMYACMHMGVCACKCTCMYVCVHFTCAHPCR